ncbi:unnamed protein product [Linum tenue]|uniref:Tyrosinase copper-binding domain-containing protein n=1 Tax=Linum tenue TaxID=586396 RepID=A0AAV0PDF8_9ROSI|nr:unnamed protein product [Linum tenue]
MASLPSAAKTPNPAANSSFLPRRHHYFSLSPSSSLRFRPKYSSGACRATSRREDDDGSHRRSTRRDVLLAGGLYGAAAALTQSPAAFSQPITAPDTTQCGAADLPAGAEPTNCCPPPARRFKDFDPTSVSSRTRVRPAAHLVDEAYVDKYKRAVELMKALPADDPRSFTQQANVHCAYCDGAYDQVGFPDLEVQVHNSWLFFPWHRYYLYFHERILGKLIGDPTFALPFWNWDGAAAGMRLPAMYADRASPLHDPLRNPNHQPPTLMDLDWSGEDVPTSAQDQISSNLAIMYRQVVSSGKTASLFLGSPYRAGDDPNPGAGSLEGTPHGPVHVWTGDSNQPNSENMGNFYSAARDPIFFGHHANIDRLWTVWKTLGGKRNDFASPDWLDATFLFYDENAEPVRVRVGDCLENKKLGYVYQDVDIPWIGSRPPPRRQPTRSRVSVFSTGTEKVANAAETTMMSSSSSFPVVLDKKNKVSVKVERARKSRSKREKEDEEEVLVVEGIQFDCEKFVKFDVYVNDEDDVVVGPGSAEFAGSFVNVPHRHKGGKHDKTRTCLRLGITDLLEDLDAEGDDSVVVTLVARTGVAGVGGVKIEFLRD